MNIEEFSALKVGDRINNPMTQSSGTVTERTDFGVLVAWGENASRPFPYTVQGTAWMHWVKQEQGE